MTSIPDDAVGTLPLVDQRHPAGPQSLVRTGSGFDRCPHRPPGRSEGGQPEAGPRPDGDNRGDSRLIGGGGGRTRTSDTGLMRTPTATMPLRNGAHFSTDFLGRHRCRPLGTARSRSHGYKNGDSENRRYNALAAAGGGPRRPSISGPGWVPRNTDAAFAGSLTTGRPQCSGASPRAAWPPPPPSPAAPGSAWPHRPAAPSSTRPTLAPSGALRAPTRPSPPTLSDPGGRSVRRP
jgi:hypothetical protein